MRARGGEVRSAKLDESIIPAIRARASSGSLQAEIARDFGVSPTTISDVVRGVTWRHVR